MTTIYKIDNSVLVQVYSKVNHLYPLFQIIFPYNSLQSIECYTVGPYLLSILYIVVCIIKLYIKVYTNNRNFNYLIYVFQPYFHSEIVKLSAKIKK